MTYRAEADALDARILQFVESASLCHPEETAAAVVSKDALCHPEETANAVVSKDDFNSLALDIFAHQLRYNEPYAKYCATFGVTLNSMPTTWEEIPPIPTAAYKEATLATFDTQNAALKFRTSGTTMGTGGWHYMESPKLYDVALLSGFEAGLLSDGADLRYLLLVPNPRENPHSSLGYMMRKVAETFSDEPARWLLSGDELRVDEFLDQINQARHESQPVLIASTAFALVQLLDELHERDISKLPLPTGSRIMETGGFKGKTRVVDRTTLYSQLMQTFLLPPNRIVAEYGMTELTSQYYDVTFPDDPAEPRIKAAPPWLRARVVGPNGSTLPKGIVGALVHVDLANRSSCIAVQTEDLGAEMRGGIILLGREQGAELRGCSLDAESLRAARA